MALVVEVAEGSPWRPKWVWSGTIVEVGCAGGGRGAVGLVVRVWRCSLDNGEESGLSTLYTISAASTSISCSVFLLGGFAAGVLFPLVPALFFSCS